jgi:putative Mn2+ efflux pump MntP
MQSVLLYSLDSFLGALAIGLLDRSETTRQKLILAFAGCDLCATLAGISLRANVAHIHVSGLAVFSAPLFLAAVAAAALAYGQKLPAGFVWIPALLSLDNFLAGLSPASVQGVRSSLISGLLSGLLAWWGFTVARSLGPLPSRNVALVASVGLTIIAFLFVG